ncbi:MAG: hypothetical protein Q9168_004345 [Polycauliona sp. 1 TL-2023]
MAKSDPPPNNGKKGAQTTRKPVDARVSFLYQAAKYFAGVVLDSSSNVTRRELDPLEKHRASTVFASGPVPSDSKDMDDNPAEVAKKAPPQISSKYDESSTPRRIRLMQVLRKVTLEKYKKTGWPAIAGLFSR